MVENTPMVDEDTSSNHLLLKDTLDIAAFRSSDLDLFQVFLTSSLRVKAHFVFSQVLLVFFTLHGRGLELGGVHHGIL